LFAPDTPREEPEDSPPPATLAASTKQDNVAADDIGHIFFLTGLLVVPRIGADAGLRCTPCRPFSDIRQPLGQLLPQHDIVPLSASCHWPSLSLKRSLVAKENFATALPCGVYLISDLAQISTRMTCSRFS